MEYVSMHRASRNTIAALSLAALAAACDPRAPQTPPIQTTPPATTSGTAATTPPAPPASAASN